MKKLFLWIILAGFLVPGTVYAQSLPNVSGVEPQPLLAQALRLDEALSFLGSALSAEDAARLRALRVNALSEETTRRIQEILDPYCLAHGEYQPRRARHGSTWTWYSRVGSRGMEEFSDQSP